MYKAANGVYLKQKPRLLKAYGKLLEERIVFQKVQPASPFMSRELAEKFAHGLNLRKFEAKEWGWNETPAIGLEIGEDAETYGGKLTVKYEGDKKCNPTGTHKDRLAQEAVRFYQAFGLNISYLIENKKINGELETIGVPTMTILSGGSTATALAWRFKEEHLPPPNALLDINTPSEKLSEMKGSYANIFLADLGAKKLSVQGIKLLTDSLETGVDLTSFIGLRDFYDFHVHETFNLAPGKIYMPYGSGRLFECYFLWQWESTRRAGETNYRLRIPQQKLSAIDLIGVTSKRLDSVAKKLTAKFNPFSVVKDGDIDAVRLLGSTGGNTGVYKIDDYWIAKAHQLLVENGIPCEESASAGLAYWLYEHRKKGGVPASKNESAAIVVTGRSQMPSS